jgi:hypothetical protein
MNPQPLPPPARKWANVTLVVIFLVLLAVPTLDTAFHLDRARPPGENRLPAEFPTFTADPAGLKNFIPGFEAYFNDHFGFRRRLISWYRLWRLDFFRDRKGFRSVVAGKDGWFYFNENQMVDHFRGTLRFTPEQLEDWRRYLENYRDWLAARGVKFLFVVAPDKESIYPENLPAWMNKVQPESKLDQFFAYMKERSTVEVLDLRPCLREARKTTPAYLKNDAHWNEFGAFMAYETLAAALARQFPEIQPAALDDFDRTNKIIPTGDLVALGDIRSAESNAWFFTPKPSLPPLETTVSDLPKRGEKMVVTQNARAGGSALVYDDSMGAYWVPFLGENFGSVTWVPDEHLTEKFFDPKFIELKKPKVVVIEVIELWFNVAKPKELMTQDQLP